MKMNMKAKKILALVVSVSALSGAGLVSVGCNSGGSAPTGQDTSAMSTADKIKHIQESSLPDQAKQSAIAMVKAHSAPGSGMTPPPTAPTN
jgi:hypothetical protein